MRERVRRGRRDARVPGVGRYAPDGHAAGRGMIRVVVAEDQSMVLGALAALLEIEPDIEVVGRRGTAARRSSSWSRKGPTSSSQTSRCR